MTLAGLFIRRPVMTTLVMVAIVLAGVVGYRQLPVSDLPNVDFPTLVVTANLPGASPKTMASSVATPLEKQFSTIAGLDSMSSINSLGLTSITLQFVLERDIDAAAQDVQAAISKTLYQLPQGLIPPSYQKVNPADQPILFMGLTSATLPLSDLDEYGETMIAQRISMLPGVAQVQVYGTQKYAVRIQMNPRELVSRNIGIDEVAMAVARGNVNLPTGILWGENRAFTVEADGQLENADKFRPLVVAYRAGAPVRLADLGKVIDSVQNDKVASWYNNNRAIVLAVLRQPGTNTVEVAKSTRTVLDEIRAQLPASVDIQILFDRSQPIQDSVNDVQFTLLLAFCLVVLVIFLFLRNLSATVIPSLALPMSLAGTFAVMALLNYSLDNLSLMALTLSVGFVVDDAIVMLENIIRHLEMGKTPLQAAQDGAREISFTIVSMTISLAAVFIPLLFMGGIVGRLFHEFAVTIGAAVLVSGAVSLTLTPMLSSRLIRASKAQRHGRLYQATERGFQGMLHVYQVSLGWVMHHMRTTLAFSLIILLATVYLFINIPKGFLPNDDYGFLFGITEAAEGISFDAMVHHQQEVAKVLLSDPNIEAFMSSVGAGGPNTANNQGRVFLRLKPRDQRALTADQVVEELRPKLSQITGIRVFLQNPPLIRLGGVLTKSLYQLTLQGSAPDALYAAASNLEAQMRALPGLQDVTSDLQLSNPQVNVSIDRDKASRLDVTAQAIEDTLYSAYGARQVSTIYTTSNQYWVILELLPEFQLGPESLHDLYVRADYGHLVPLESMASIRTDVGPLSINHAGQLMAVTLSFNLRPGHSIGEAVAAVGALAHRILPAGITTNFAGTAQAFKASESGLGWLLLAALAVIYLVLGILYESFIHPLTILTGLPFAGFGALATLWIFGMDLNVYSFVGLIMLIGVVKKNAIMMIDFALNAQKREGLPPDRAILQACSVRFRPIMMTTIAALMATLPIALGIGAGSASRQPLGLVVVGGLLFSQLVTLYVTPVFYVYLDAFQSWLNRTLRGPRTRPLTQPANGSIEGR